MTVKRLSRKQITEGLDQIPMSEILSVNAKALTPKMKSFAREVAMGKTKADAYRSAYKQDASKTTTNNEPYRLTADPRIAREIEAYQRAIEAAKHRTPAALRELVIQSLVSTLLDPDEKGSVRIQAAKILGQVSEVSAFTIRTEVRTISSSDDIKAKVMDELKRLMAGSVEDVTAKEADSLLAELLPAAEPTQIDQPSDPTVPPSPLDEGGVT